MTEKGKDFFSLSFGNREQKNSARERIEIKEGGLFWHLAGGGLALVPAFIFALRQDMPHIFLLCLAIILGGGLFFRKGFRDLERPLIYCGITALMLTVIPDMMMPPDERRFGFFDMLVRTTLTVPLLLYLSCMGGLFRPTPQLAGARAALALLAMLICGDRFFAAEFENTFLGFLNPLLKHYNILYGISALLTSLLIPLLFLSINPREDPEEKRGKRRNNGTKLRLFFLLAVPLAAWGGMEVFRQNPELLVKLERFFLGMGGRRSPRWHARMGKIVLAKDVNLRRPFPYIPPEKKKVLFYVKNASGRELYLRTSVCNLYFNGIWKGEAAGRRKELTSWQRMGILSYTSFLLPFPDEWSPETEEALEKKKKEWERVDLHFVSLETNGLIPAPGNVTLMDAVADEGFMDALGLLSLRYWRKDGGVTLYLEKKKKELSSPFGESASLMPPLLSGEGKAQFFQVPPALEKNLQKFLAEQEKTLPAGKKIKDMTREEKIVFIRDRLLSFRYEERYQDPGWMDPVSYFLLSNKKGHCELFNTALVLLLRFVGVPARYVRGFYCSEASPGHIHPVIEGHAWGEVYLEKEKRWVTVDATPPSFRGASGERSFFREKKDRFSYILRELFANVRRGYFAESMVKIFQLLFSGILELFKIPYLFVTGPFSALLLFFLYSRKLRKAREAERQMGIPPEKRALIKGLQKWEKGFVRLVPDLPKRPVRENPALFYLKFFREEENFKARLVKSLLQQYIYLRFRKEPLKKEEEELFFRQLASFRKKWKEGEKDE